MIQEKRCTKCKKAKPFNKFSKNKRYKNGLHNICKSCDNDRVKEYCRTKKGLITNIYGHQRKSSKRRNHPMPLYSKQEFSEFCLASPKFHRLYNQWKEFSFHKMLSPSFDRDDDYKGYSFENFNKWMTWAENKQKGHDDMQTGKIHGILLHKAVIGTHKITGEKVEFYSVHEAERQTGINESHISKCCLGKKYKKSKGRFYIVHSAGGYIWRHAND